MTANIITDKTELKKGDTVTYTVTVNSDMPINSTVIEIISSAEIFPEAAIIPDISSITSDSGVHMSGEMSDEGIFTVTVPDANELHTVSFSYMALAKRISENNTTAAMVTVNHSGGISEAYAQTVLSPSQSASFIPAAASLTVLIAAAFIFYRIFLHSR